MSRERCDVVILGGGLAGLSLAIHMKRRRPQTSIVVLEKKPHPLPEAAHKVGESTLEIGAAYFARECGMEEHLEKEHLPKMGLRFIFNDGDKADVTTRTELGLSEFAPAPTYQIDRGVFETALAVEAERQGVKFIDDCSVTSVDLNGGAHTVTARTPSQQLSYAAQWVVDASGRAAILKRKMALGEEVPHHCNAAWFRINDYIKLDDFTTDSEWRDRVPGHTRWLSTDHLLGPGYWFWLIPLGSGNHSFGLVADPDLVPWEDMRRFEPLMEWLHRNEPQAAALIEPHRDGLMDFRILKHFSHGCKRVFSPDRWALTGEAGVFMDPLYSPGSDTIATSNKLLAKLVCDSLDGRDNAEDIEFFNAFYLLLFKQLLPIWDHQYPIFADPAVTSAKLAWDLYSYFNGLVLFTLMGSDQLGDRDFLFTIIEDLHRTAELNVNMQRYLQDWARLKPGLADEVGYAGLTYDAYMERNKDVAQPNDDWDWLRESLHRNTKVSEATAIEIMARTAAAIGVDARPDEINPYSFTLTGADVGPGDAPLLDEVPMLEPRRRPEDGPTGLAWATHDDPTAATSAAYCVWPGEPSSVPA